MDRILASEAGDLGSNPSGSTQRRASAILGQSVETLDAVKLPPRLREGLLLK